ncbi:MAG: HigA family addiction module antidote protein [Alphaproteobacteria bacterium]|nr:HigA family addiction module antidote protein [Alphaproteobacteria bacterium]MCK5556387.1 HigA family addiction module antidote protein [Alphaproteobacteria bacterium]
MSMKNPIHPGRIIKGCLDDLDLDITRAAKVLGVSRQTVSRVVNGKTTLSDEMAIRLAKAFGSTPEMWMRMQHSYDLAQIPRKIDTIDVQPYQHSVSV